MKNIVIATLTVIILGLMVFTFQQGPAFQGGEAGKITEDIAGRSVNAAVTTGVEEKDDRKKEDDKLNALREKAGNMATFKVSDMYKRKCASCHGVNGTGEQNGKNLMGPKLIGQSESKIYQSLVDFKTGKIENSVMRGLLISLDDKDFKELSKEIGEFQSRADALQ
jgi:cytochrome c553